MRLLPRSLFGRLVLLLLLGLLGVQLLSIGLLLGDRTRTLYRAAGVSLVQRMVRMVTLLDTLPEAYRRRVVTALDLPPLQLSLDLAWQSIDPVAASPLMVEYLARRLPAGRRIEVVAVERVPVNRWWMTELDASRPLMHHRARRDDWQLRTLAVQIALADGRPLTFRFRLPKGVDARPYTLLITLALLVLSAVGLTILAVRSLTRPLAILAGAATALGRNIHHPSLPERGPLEVVQAAQAFNTMQTRLQRYIEDRSRILAAVSHDLKTPITRLRLRSELLDNPEVATRFQADLDDMETMVQATLDFMRGTDSSETSVALDLNALLEALVDDYRDQGHELALVGTASRAFSARPVALKRCLGNLIDNALKYGREVCLQLQDSPSEVSLAVLDRGPGIPAEQLDTVFEPFFRLESSRTRESGGSGLGLGIARNIARGHGGELTLENRAEGGLAAVLRLPR